MSHIFVSYAREDLDKASMYAEVLKQQGWEVWWDREGITLGRSFSMEIENALDDAWCVLVLWSKASVVSMWVSNEATEGLNRGVLVPVLLEDVRIPLQFRGIQGADLRGWSGDDSQPDFQRLLHSIQSLAPAPRSAGSKQDSLSASPLETSQVNELNTDPQKGLYVGGITFLMNRTSGCLQLVPVQEGLRMLFVPVTGDQMDWDSPGYINVLLPLDAVGGLWATSRAFLYAVESFDENIILHGSDGADDLLIKLYRDKPHTENGRPDGSESCWLRIVNGKTEEMRRRVKLGPRDLLSLELACQAVLACASSAGTMNPRPYIPAEQHHEPNIELTPPPVTPPPIK